MHLLNGRGHCDHFSFKFLYFKGHLFEVNEMIIFDKKS